MLKVFVHLRLFTPNYCSHIRIQNIWLALWCWSFQYKEFPSAFHYKGAASISDHSAKKNLGGKQWQFMQIKKYSHNLIIHIQRKYSKAMTIPAQRKYTNTMTTLVPRKYSYTMTLSVQKKYTNTVTVPVQQNTPLKLQYLAKEIIPTQWQWLQKENTSTH